MQRDALLLFILDVHLNLCVFSSLLVFEFRPNDVIRSPGGHPLREIPARIRDHLPARLLLVRAPDRDLQSAHRTPLGVKDTAGDDRIRRSRLLLFISCGEQGRSQQEKDDGDLPHSSSSSSTSTSSSSSSSSSSTGASS